MTSIAERLVQRQRRRTRGTLLFWSAAAMLGAYAWMLGCQRGWIDATAAWALLPVAGSIHLLQLWLRCVWTLTDADIARQLDQRFDLNGRIESVLEMRAESSPLAVAQRTETDTILERKTPDGTLPWLAGLVALCAGIGIVGAAYIATPKQPAIAAAAIAAVAPAKPVVAEPVQPPPPPEPLRASLAWRSPAKTVTAAPTEEVPLLAFAESNHGFRALTLEVSVNGTARPSKPVTPAILGLLNQPGSNEIKLSLFLDETGAAPCDFVTYQLRGEAKYEPSHPVILSPRQLVEIVPAVASQPPDILSDIARQLLGRISDLRRTQIELLDRTLELAEAPPSFANPERDTTTRELATAQQRLAVATKEAVGLAGQAGAAAAAVNNLNEAEASMLRAADQIAARSYSPAVEHQAVALARLAEAERGYRSALALAKPASDAPASAPGDLESRSQTPAGKLEQLSRRQAENNRRLMQPLTATDRVPALIATEQAQIARDIERLAREHSLAAPVQKPVEKAVGTSAEAARQLELNDLQAARIPATETQALLEHALALQESEGRKAAARVIDQVRSELNQAALITDPSLQQKQQDQAIGELSTEAKRQQRQGSEDAARKLSDLAKKMNDAKQKSEKQVTADEKKTEAESTGIPEEEMVPQETEWPKTYVAMLQPTPDARGSKASGRAILQRFDPPSGTLELQFSGLSSKQTTARLKVGGTGAKGVIVLDLRTGQFTSRRWEMKPAGGLTTEDILRALADGKLFVEIGTAAHPEGELTGAFGRLAMSPKSKAGGGASSGGPRRLGTTNQKAAAMPTMLNDAGASTERLLDLATVAAESQVALAPDASLAQTIRQLKAAAAKRSPEDSASTLAMLQSAAQKAQALAPGSPLAEVARALATKAGGDLGNAENIDPAALKSLLEQAAQLATDLEQRRPTAKPDDWTRRFSPDEIDPDYRKPVEDYFEKLSRDGAAR